MAKIFPPGKMFFPKYSEIGAEEGFNPVSFQLVDF